MTLPHPPASLQDALQARRTRLRGAVRAFFQDPAGTHNHSTLKAMYDCRACSRRLIAHLDRVGALGEEPREGDVP